METHQLMASVGSFFNFLTKLLTQSITKDLIHSPLAGSGHWSLMAKPRQGAGSRAGEREKRERERHEVLYLSRQLPSPATEVQPAHPLVPAPLCCPRSCGLGNPGLHPNAQDVSLRLLMGWTDMNQIQPNWWPRIVSWAWLSAAPTPMTARSWR